MPRGVYKRAQTVAKAAAAGAPKGQALPETVAPVIAAPVVADAPREFTREDFRKPIADMRGALLKAFARHVGVSQRDVDRLTEDRLRQNCTVMQMAALED